MIGRLWTIADAAKHWPRIVLFLALVVVMGISGGLKKGR
jgi:hypothetical protein